MNKETEQLRKDIEELRESVASLGHGINQHTVGLATAKVDINRLRAHLAALTGVVTDTRKMLSGRPAVPTVQAPAIRSQHTCMNCATDCHPCDGVRAAVFAGSVVCPGWTERSCANCGHQEEAFACHDCKRGPIVGRLDLWVAAGLADEWDGESNPPVPGCEMPRGKPDKGTL